ncbi:MFS transporter [Actinoplanes sp. NPDC051851]|uniref:MFS transporter n=1 Tax=Actinoplanes sp. NPDC051851 TaxID=3154753 RepID=UPI003423B6B3
MTTTESPIEAPASHRKLLLSLFPANVSMFLLWGAIPSILLALQVEGIDPDNKAGNLAIVYTIGALAAMIAQPLGTVSDRTRSKYGRRAPWIVGGALVGGLGLIGMAAANTLVQIGIGWVIVQIAYNFCQGPLSAIMPDRVPPAVRGMFSAVAGFAMMLGAIGGQLIGAAFADDIGGGYVLFAGLALVTFTLFVVISPDRDNRADERRPFDLGALLRTFYFNPRKHPDFGWAFIGRLLLYLGYFMVSNYQLYILQEYIGLGDDAVNKVAVLGGASLIPTLIATLLGGPLSDRLKRRKPLIYLASIICGVALLIPWLMPTLTGMVIFSMLNGFGFGLFGSVDTALVSEVLPAQEDAAKDLGVINIAATLPQVFAPGVAGAIVVATGYGSLFPIAIVLMILGGFAVWPIKTVR